MNRLSLETLVNADTNGLTAYTPIQIWIADAEMEAAREVLYVSLDAVCTHFSIRTVATTHGPDSGLNQIAFFRYEATPSEMVLNDLILNRPDETNPLRHKMLRHSGEAYPVDKALRMAKSLRRYAERMLYLYEAIRNEAQNNNDYWWQYDTTTCDDLDRAARFVWDGSDIQTKP